MIELGFRKILRLLYISQINYLPQPLPFDKYYYLDLPVTDNLQIIRTSRLQV